MKCPECQADNPSAAKFCGSCGHGLVVKETPGGKASSGGTAWDSVFKWIGICVVGLFVLGLLAGL
jgi:hypothetical protein